MALTSTSRTKHGSSRHGAVIYRGGRALCHGTNIDKNSVYVVPDPRTQSGVHAEARAIRKALADGIDLEGATIYVARVLKSGKPAMSKPCVNCQELLKSVGIRKVFYTIDRSMEL